MSLWGNLPGEKPKWLSTDEKSNVVLLDSEDVKNSYYRLKGAKTAGWYKIVPRPGSTRYVVECLVAMSNTQQHITYLVDSNGLYLTDSIGAYLIQG